MGDTKQFVPHSHIPYGAEGDGYYSDNTLGCYDVVANAQPLVLRALDKVEKQDGVPLNICDYGTADGGTSMFLLGTCVDNIKEKHGKDKEIMVYYEDQPSNDFKSVIKRIHGLLPGGAPSYALKHSGVHTACVGTGFYSKCLPANTIHLGISFTAMHWLSKRPGVLSDAIHHLSSENKEDTAAFKQQAAEDWETNLMNRAHELSPGGQMVIVCFCIDNEGQYLGKTKRIKNSMFERMTTNWANMVKEGKITQEEFVETNFNNYYRSVDEYSAPFNDPKSKVSQAGLKLVSIETNLVPCRYHAKWEANGKKEDAEAAKAHAKWYVPTTRTWSNSTFRSALKSSRSEEEKDRLVDDLFSRYEADVAANPMEHGMDYIHAYIHIEKVA